MTQEAEQKTPTIVLYGLQTCSHCKAAKKMLEGRKATFRMIYVEC